MVRESPFCISPAFFYPEFQYKLILETSYIQGENHLMKKKFIAVMIGLIIIALICVFFFVIILRPYPRLEISEASWNFGEVIIGSDISHSIIIKNLGNAVMTFYAYPSCPACMSLEFDKTSIPPNSEIELKIKIHETVAGPYERYIRIESNDPDQLVRTVNITGVFIDH